MSEFENNTIVTLSDYLDSIEAANPGLDLNAVIAGETILPTENFKYSLLKNPLGDNHSGIVGEFGGASSIYTSNFEIGDTFYTSFWFYGSPLNTGVTGVLGRNLNNNKNTKFSIWSIDGRLYIYIGNGVSVEVFFFVNTKLEEWKYIEVLVNYSTKQIIAKVNEVIVLNTNYTITPINDNNIFVFGAYQIGAGFTHCKISNINLNNQAIYPLSGDVIDTVSGLPATNNGVTFTSLNKVTKGIKLRKP